MSTFPEGQADSGGQRASATLSRLMLGKALRRLREAAEISRDTAGKAILDYYRHWMNLLTTQAEEPDATPEILRRLLAET